MTPAQELDIARNVTRSPEFRADAYKRYSAKRWYEAIVLQIKVEIDLRDIAPQEAAEVARLRTLVGTKNPPWMQKEIAA